MKLYKSLLGAVLLLLSVTLILIFYNQNKLKKMTVETPLIPRSVLFGNPDKSSVRISPDGLYISYVAPLDGVLNVFVAPKDNIAAAKAVTNDKKRGIYQYHWLYDGSLVYYQDDNGDENHVIYRVDIKNNKTDALTPHGAKSSIRSLSYKYPNEILIANNQREKQWFDVYKLDLSSLKQELVFQNDKYCDLTYDDEFKLRLGNIINPDSSVDIYVFNKDQQNLYKHISPLDVELFDVIGFDKDSKSLYYVDSSQSNTAALYIDDLAGNKTMLAKNAKTDIQKVYRHPIEKTLQFYTCEYEREEKVFLDKKVEQDFAFLQDQAEPDLDVLIVSRTLQDHQWVVAFTGPHKPLSYYLYDRQKRNLTFLFYNRDSLQNQPLVKMHPVVIKSRDGLDLVSYLSLPLNSDSRGFIPAKPVPMVLFVHGGPIDRDSWGYVAYHQWLANRGYAVLSVNYRGSTGFGKDFINAADGQWGGKMQDDLTDAVEWAIGQGIAIGEKVAIMGGSYGGYAALVGATFTPNYFACAIDIVGISNLNTMVESVPQYWKPVLALIMKRIGGDPSTPEGKEFLASRSPLNFADKIIKPLLIAQGAKDPRVKQAESDQIVQKLQEHKIPVTYLLYPDEGHGFARPENSRSFSAIAEQFLAMYLGGAFEVVGSDLNGSSMQIVSGGDLVKSTDKEIVKAIQGVK